MEMATSNDPKGYVLLKRIVEEFLKDYHRPLNYSQLATALKANRQFITGAVNILHELGLLRCIHQRQTNKLFLIDLPLNYCDVIIRLRQIIPPDGNFPKDISAVANADLLIGTEEIERVGEHEKSYSESGKVDYSEDEWVQAVDPLLKLALTPEQIEEYYKILQEKKPPPPIENKSFSLVGRRFFPLNEKLMDDFYSTRLGQALPATIRFKIVVTFITLFKYGLFQFSNAFLQAYLKSKVNENRFQQDH